MKQFGVHLFSLWRYPGYLALLLYCLLLSPQALHFLESRMVLHMLVQIPLLVLVGWLFGMAARPLTLKWCDQWNRFGLPGILLALFTLGFWMLPQNLDASLSTWTFELGKLLALPFLCGLPLALSWKQTVPMVRGFLQTNLISMLLFLSWLYAYAPVRICNNYLINDQQQLAVWLLYGAGLLSLYWSVGLFFGRSLWLTSPYHPPPVLKHTFKEDARS